MSEKFDLNDDRGIAAEIDGHGEIQDAEAFSESESLEPCGKAFYWEQTRNSDIDDACYDSVN